METGIIGMLYLVDIKLYRKSSNEKIKQKLLVVGCEADDIERKLRWAIDTSKYDNFMITNVEKVRNKVHLLSTRVKQIDEGLSNPVIVQGESTKIVDQTIDTTEKKGARKFAVGLATQVFAIDEDSALRKVGHALVSRTMGKSSASGASLSPDSTLTIEELAPRENTARARDVSNEIRRAHIVRG